MTSERSVQEEFWEGEFGDSYTERNTGAAWIASNAAMFARVLSHTSGIRSVVEFGANRGLNLAALRQLLPEASLTGVEINRHAAERLQAMPGVSVHIGSLYEFPSDHVYDLAFTKGVLIHLNPERLPDAYDKLFQCSSRYVMVAEYFNPSPIAIPYRGHTDRLFKRDFAGELWSRHPSMRLLDYGFSWHRDPNFPQDDLTWFLFEKGSGAKTCS